MWDGHDDHLHLYNIVFANTFFENIMSNSKCETGDGKYGDGERLSALASGYSGDDNGNEGEEDEDEDLKMWMGTRT